jgi:hypothetical protein
MLGFRPLLQSLIKAAILALGEGHTSEVIGPDDFPGAAGLEDDVATRRRFESHKGCDAACGNQVTR